MTNAVVEQAIRRQKSRWRLVAPAMGRFVHVAMFCLIATACTAGIWYLWSRALGDPRFRMEGETLSLAGAVRECPESVAELERLGKRFDGRSLLDPGLVGDMEKAYGECVWIKKITRMRRRFPNRMEVEFLLRMPAAQVWHEGRSWLIDMDGTVLPVEGRETVAVGLPEIVGVTSDVIGVRPAAGRIWDDEGVQGALGLLRVFWGSPLAEVLPLERIVINAGALRGGGAVVGSGRPRFELVTSQGAVVRWGTYNGGDVAGELTSAEKLYHLQGLLRNDEALNPGVCFDVRTRLPGYTLFDG